MVTRSQAQSNAIARGGNEHEQTTTQRTLRHSIDAGGAADVGAAGIRAGCDGVTAPPAGAQEICGQRGRGDEVTKPATAPEKKKEKKPRTGPRSFNGVALDVRGAAAFLGTTDKTVRAMVERKLLPYRRLNSRIILLRTELEGFLVDLPGCTPDEARANHEARQ